MDQTKKHNKCIMILLMLLAVFIGVFVFFSLNLVNNLEKVADEYNNKHDILIDIFQKYDDISLNREEKAKTIIANHNNFMSDYYSTQSEWLNIWLASLGALVTILGIVFPIFFMAFYAHKSNEFNEIIKHAQDARKKIDDFQSKLELESNISIEKNENKFRKFEEDYKSVIDKSIFELTDRAINAQEKIISLHDALKAKLEDTIEKNKATFESLEEKYTIKVNNKFSLLMKKANSAEDRIEKLIEKSNLTFENIKEKYLNKIDDKLKELDFSIDKTKKLENNMKITELVMSINFEINQNRYNRAIELINVVFTVDPKNTHGYYYLGIIYLHRKQYRSCIDICKRGLIHNTDDLDLLINLAYAYTKNSDMANAIPIFKKVIKEIPNDLEAIVNLSHCYNTVGKYNESIELLEDSLYVDRTESNLLYNLFHAYIMKNDFKVSLETLNKYLKYDQKPCLDENDREKFMKVLDAFQDDSNVKEIIQILKSIPDEKKMSNEEKVV